MREEKGWLFPENVEIPDQSWYRMDFGDTVRWDLDRAGHEELARQSGMYALESEITQTGEADGVLYAAVEAVIRMEYDDTSETYRAVAGADVASQQVRDPEHVWSVAESRAIKRAVKRALGIRPAETDVDPDTGPDSGRGAPDGAGPEVTDDDPEQIGSSDPLNDADDLDW